MTFYLIRINLRLGKGLLLLSEGDRDEEAPEINLLPERVAAACVDDESMYLIILITVSCSIHTQQSPSLTFCFTEQSSTQRINRNN